MTAFSQTEFPRLSGAQVHHIIPEALENHRIIRLLRARAADSFRFNDANNAIYLETRNIPGHAQAIHNGYDAAHSGYNLAWGQVLDSIEARVGEVDVASILNGTSHLSLDDQQGIVNTVRDLVNEAQDRARAGLQRVDGFGPVSVNNNDAAVRDYALRNSTANYDLSTADGWRSAARDMALGAIDINREISPELHARIQMNRALFGDALPLAGLRSSRFFGDDLEQSLFGTDRLSASQRADLLATKERLRMVGIEPRVGFNSPGIYFQALVETAADQGPTSAAGIELRAVRDRLRLSPELGASIALNTVQFSLAIVEIYDLLRQGKTSEAAVRIGEMTWETFGSALGSSAAGAWAASIVSRVALAGSAGGLAVIIISTALGDQIGSTLFGQLYRGLYAAGLIDSSGLRSILQQALDNNTPGVSRAPDGTFRYQGEPIEEPDPLPVGDASVDVPRCFVAGTPILMADGCRKPIEDVSVGDFVMAFDPAENAGRGRLRPRRVTRTFTNSARRILDLRGLRMTPGHVCLTDNGRFETIAGILARDGLLFDESGEAVRARTGAKAGSPEDALVRICFSASDTDRERYATVRAGIPCRHRRLPDGSSVRVSLAEILALEGLSPHADGSFVGKDGKIKHVVEWPGETPSVETNELSTFIVFGADGRFHIPAWIRALLADPEHEAPSGGARRFNVPGNGFSISVGGSPISGMVGRAVASMPLVGASVPITRHSMFVPKF